VSIATGCAEYGSEVSAYLDDGLGAEERTRVEQHLASCASCAALLRESRALDRTLRELPRIQPSSGFESRLQARLGRQTAPQRRRRGLLRFAAASAAAAAVLALLVAPGSAPLSDEDWELIADEQSFDLMLSDDHELVYALDVLEAWDEQEEI
jgi:anti-sigma factor RsiW